MNKIENLIFDLDGTLIDSSEGVVSAVNYSLRQMGENEQPPEIIKRYIGYPLSKMYPDFSDKPVPELYKHFQTKAKETIVSSTRLLDGVQDTLNKLKDEHYRLAIATTKIKNHVDGIIDKFDWHNLILCASGGDEVKQVKPAPDIFELTLEKMNGKIENSIVIGDTENDILAARAIGIKSVGVTSPYGDSEKLLEAKPDYTINAIAELIPLLDKINR